MKLVDLIVLVIVLGGIGITVYRTMWKKKTFCPGCDGCGAAAESPKDSAACSGGCCK